MASKEFERALAALATEVPELVHRDFSAIVRRELADAEERGMDKLIRLESALEFLASIDFGLALKEAIRDDTAPMGSVFAAICELAESNGWNGKAVE